MSRFYEMGVEISGHDPEKVSEIQKAAEKEWPFADWWFSGDENQSEQGLSASAQHSLYGGESEEQFVERLSVAIWRANGGFCRVYVNATYLESLPYEMHSLEESDYDRLIHVEHNPCYGETGE